jgi:hypothetical protein
MWTAGTVKGAGQQPKEVFQGGADEGRTLEDGSLERGYGDQKVGLEQEAGCLKFMALAPGGLGDGEGMGGDVVGIMKAYVLEFRVLEKTVISKGIQCVAGKGHSFQNMDVGLWGPGCNLGNELAEQIEPNGGRMGLQVAEVGLDGDGP